MEAAEQSDQERAEFALRERETGGEDEPEPRPERDEPAAPAAGRSYPDRRPAEPASVQQAIDDVTRVVETLKETLDDMEEVLETLELAERQKDADEREIEALRSSLRQMQRGGPDRGPRPEGRAPREDRGR